MHVGLGRNAFSLNYDIFRRLLPISWVKYILCFVQNYGIILPTNNKELGVKHDRDILLMKEFGHSNFSLSKLKIQQM